MPQTIAIELPEQSALDYQASFVAKLRSVTPLLMHRPGSMMANDGEVQRSNRRKIPTPQEECDLAVYKDQDGYLYGPSKWFQRSMIEAGKQFQNPQNRRQTMFKLVAASLAPPEVLGFTLLDPENELPLDHYEIDLARVVVQKAAVMRARPRVDSWITYINFGLDLTTFGEGDPYAVGKFFRDLLTLAGRKQGIGDDRPERAGAHGRFRVEQFEITVPDD